MQVHAAQSDQILAEMRARHLAHAATVAHYNIIDRHTGSVVAKAKTLRAAIRAVDRRDNEYGAYRYAKVAVYL